MQGCFNGNAFDWDQQFWSDIGDYPIYRVRYMRVSVLCEADIGEFYCIVQIVMNDISSKIFPSRSLYFIK
jgi:hypothetical protein